MKPLLFPIVTFVLLVPIYATAASGIAEGSLVFVLAGLVGGISALGVLLLATSIKKSSSNTETPNRNAESLETRQAVRFITGLFVIFMANMIFAGLWVYQRVDFNDLVEKVQDLIAPTPTPSLYPTPMTSADPLIPDDIVDPELPSYDELMNKLDTPLLWGNVYSSLTNGKGFSFRYPSGWNLRKNESESWDYVRQQAIDITTPTISLSDDPAVYVSISYEIDNGACVHMETFYPQEEAEIISVGIYDGYRFTRTYDSIANISYIVEVVYVPVGDRCYMIYSQDTGNADNINTIRSIVQSVKIF